MVAGDISVVFAECSPWAGIWAKLGNTKPTAITRATRIVIISRGQDLFATQCSKPVSNHSASAEMGWMLAIASHVLPEPFHHGKVKSGVTLLSKYNRNGASKHRCARCVVRVLQSQLAFVAEIPIDATTR